MAGTAKNNIKIPDSWKSYLGSMSQYLADCCGDYGEVIAFGDNDEGKILDLQGKIQDHYRYVLQLMGDCIKFPIYRFAVCGEYQLVDYKEAGDRLSKEKAL